MPQSVDGFRLRVAVIGPGGIGSTFAFQLSNAGHDVTVVARGTRLRHLLRDKAIVTANGLQAPVQVVDKLDTTVAWDLVLVTVLVSEVDPLLPTLASCAADTIMFMFNTFRPLNLFRDAVGAQRVVFGFPAMVASIDHGKLSSTILRRGVRTTVSDSRWTSVFSDAGIRSTTQADMESWLRTHTAAIVPLMLAAHNANRNGHGVSRREAAELARALREGLRLVRRLGSTITPSSVGIVDRLPIWVLTAMLWALTRLPAFVKTTSIAPRDEPAALIDEMNSIAPQAAPALLAIRPK
jgi:2-dehydropantoate 2-reductase